MNRAERTGYACAFACAFFSAVMIVLIKWTAAALPLFSLLFLCQAAAGITLTGVLLPGMGRRLRRTPRRGWAWLAGISGLTFFAYGLTFEAIHLLDPTVASFLGRTETLVTILFGVAVLGERFRRHEAAGGALVFAGVVCLRYTGGVAISRGFLYCLAGAACWGISEGLAKVAVRHVDPLLFTWGRSLLLCPVFLAAAFFSSEGLVLPGGAGTWAGVAGIALSGPVVARYLYMKSLSLIPVSKAALVNQTQPVGVALIAGLTLGQVPAPKEWVGGALILLGCMLLVASRNRKPRTTAPEDPASQRSSAPRS